MIENAGFHCTHENIPGFIAIKAALQLTTSNPLKKKIAPWVKI